jgi:AraC-like DNA-binding protein
MLDLRLILKRAHIGRGERGRNYETTWRTLPFLLLEYSDDGEWQVEFKDSVVAIPPGETFVIPSNRYHRLTVPRSAKMHSTWFVFQFEYSSGMPLTWQRDAGPRLGALSKPVREHLDAMATWLEAGRVDVSREVFVLTQAFSMLKLLAPKCLNITEPDARSVRLQPVLEHIHANLGHEIRRSELAQMLHLSPTRFHTVFKDAMGVAPLEYVLLERIRRARELLVASSLNVSEIAAQCGFNSPFYFSRIFRARVGQAPSEYREASLSGR